MTFDLLKQQIENSFSEEFKDHAIGSNLNILEEVDSTNLYALQHSNSLKEGAVIVALSQTAGRGRKGRLWHSQPGSGLYMSILLKRVGSMGDSNTLNLLASLAVFNALKNDLKLKDKEKLDSIELKWPNDILYNSGKLAGILSERKSGSGTTIPTVIGIGVNVNHTLSDFPPDIADNCTSLHLIDSQKRDIFDTAKKILVQMNNCYDDLVHNGTGHIINAWMQNSPSCRGTRVRVFSDNEEFSAVTEGLDQRGFLKVRRYGDRLQTLLSADIVSLRRL